MNFLKKESAPQNTEPHHVDAVHVVLTRPIHKAQDKRPALSANSITTTVQTLIAGLVFGVAATVLYQNISGRQVGEPIVPVAQEEATAQDKGTEAQTKASATKTEAEKQPVTHTKTPAKTPTKAASPTAGKSNAVAMASVAPAPATASVPAPTAIKEQPLPMANLPLLPAPRATPIKVVSLGAGPAMSQTKDDDADDSEGGIHVEFRKKNPQSTKSEAGPRASSNEPGTTLPAPSTPEKPIKPNADPQPAAPQGKPPTPSFNILHRQDDGVTIRTGNQVRFLPNGSLLPDGTKVGASAQR